MVMNKGFRTAYLPEAKLIGPRCTFGLFLADTPPGSAFTASTPEPNARMALDGRRVGDPGNRAQDVNPIAVTRCLRGPIGPTRGGWHARPCCADRSSGQCRFDAWRHGPEAPDKHQGSVRDIMRLDRQIADEGERALRQVEMNGVVIFHAHAEVA